MNTLYPSPSGWPGGSNESFLGLSTRGSWVPRLCRHLLACLALPLLTLTPGFEASAQTITRVSAPGKFYVNDKAGAGVVYNYAIYAISNNTASPLVGPYVVITNLVPTNRITLAAQDTGVRPMGILAPGEVRLAAFYLKGPSFTGNSDTLLNVTNETHTIRVLDGPPGVGAVLTSSNFSYTNIIFVIEAAANKVRIITNLNPYAVLGSEVPLVIAGDTGTIGGQNSVAFSPAVLGSWRPDAYEMVGSIVRFTANPTYTNRMYFDPGVPGFTNYAGQSYTNTIFFRAVKVTGTNLPISPFAFIDSGSGTKHTDLGFLAGSGGSNVVVAATNSVAIVSHTVTPGSLLAPGGTVTYSVTFSNFAGLPVSMDEIVNVLPGFPANVTYIPGTATYNSAPLEDPDILGQNLRWALAFPIAANGSGTLTFQALAPLTAGSYTNRVTAVIGAEQIDTTLDTTDNSPATAVFTVVPVSDLGVIKSAAGVVNATNLLTYTLTVTNAGPSPATSITLTDVLPPAVSFVSASAGGSHSSGTVVWTNLGPLAASNTLSVTITVAAPAEAASLTNTASVSSPILDPNSGDNNAPMVVTTVTPVADLGLQKVAPPVVAPGVNFNYSLLLTNLGPSTASNVTVVDALDTNLTFVSASHGGVFSGGNVLWTNLGNLPPNTGLTLTLTVTAPLTGGATNTATISSPTSDPNGGNNTNPPTISVVGNVPPTTVNDFAATLKNTPVTVPVLANDTDDNGDPLTLIAVTETNGTATVVGTNVVFNPATDFVGTVLLTYTVIDGQGGTNTGLITINVTNNVPVITWNPDGPIVYGTPLGTNQNNAVLSVPGTASYGPTNGTVLPVGTNLLSVTYTPTDTNYAPVSTTRELVVLPATLTVTADSQT
ncbi:MAG: Ig-like domain-containing protein, partial [Limisphaerales bacterium]